MKLIDLYVSEVGRRLPARNRADIENELRSILLDMLEDRAKQEGREADDRMVKAILKEYGSPQKVAASYGTEGYLIGPRMYPTFIMVMKIVLSVVVTLGVIGLGVRIGQNASSSALIGKALMEAIGGIFQGVFQAFASVVFIFAILERYLPKEPAEPETWDPSELESLTPPDKVKMGEVITTLIFTVLFLIIFNFYPNLIRIYFKDGQVWKSIPFLTDVFYRYILFFDLIWLMQITLNILVLRDGIWTRTTRIFEIVLNAFNLVMLIVMIFGPSIVQLPLESITSNGIQIAGAHGAEVQTAFIGGFRTVLGLVAGITLVTTGKKVYDLVK
jgi:hypothetical protein